MNVSFWVVNTRNRDIEKIVLEWVYLMGAGDQLLNRAGGEWAGLPRPLLASQQAKRVRHLTKKPGNARLLATAQGSGPENYRLQLDQNHLIHPQENRRGQAGPAQ